MNSNDSRKIKAYEESERLLRLAGEHTNALQVGGVDPSRRDALHLRIGHLEQQALGWAALAGLDLPPNAHEEEKA
jgi:hypothetical protein